MTARTQGFAVETETLLRTATSFMSAKLLLAAHAAGLFRALTVDRPRTTTEIATDLGITERVAGVLAQGVVCTGLVIRSDEGYLATPASVALLGDPDDERYLGEFLAFLDEVSYPHWTRFSDAVASGTHAPFEPSPEQFQKMVVGVDAYRRLHARLLAERFDFGGHRRALDLAGMDPHFSIAALRAAPDLAVRFAFDAAAEPVLRGALAAAGLESRAEVGSGDPLGADLGSGYDLVLVIHAIHRYAPDEVVELLGRARAAAAPGARLILMDFLLDSRQAQRPIDAAHAGEYLVVDGTVVHPENSVHAWLAQAGWKVDGSFELPGSPRCITAVTDMKRGTPA